MATMDMALAAALRLAGNDLPAVAELYAPVLAAQDRTGVQILTDIRYGSHERHLLDLYIPLAPVPDRGWPVVVFFHGGGFIRGNKEHRQNIGVLLAQQGMVAVLPNYRLAPGSQWPSGPQDVAKVWQWLTQQGHGHHADASRIVLMGESAGAAHVAAATLRTEFQPQGWAIAGAVLLSGPYNARLEGLARSQFDILTPDPRNEPYFGMDQSAWGAASTVDNITAPSFPLMISYAEQDLIQMHVQAGELFARLTSQHGYQPELMCIPYHNHFSQGYSFGTADTSVSSPVLHFIRKVTNK